MLEMPKDAASSCSASTFTLATFTAPSYSSAIRSMTGATNRHGPHHAAQKSTRTGTSERATSLSNVAAVSSIGLLIVSVSLLYFPSSVHLLSPTSTTQHGDSLLLFMSFIPRVRGGER